MESRSTTCFFYSFVMFFSMKQFRAHISKFDNAVIYGLFGLLFILTYAEEGILVAIYNLAAIVYFVSVLYLTVRINLVKSIKEYFSALIFVIPFSFSAIYALYLLIEHRSQHTYFQLLVPIAVGIALIVVYSFWYSKTGRKISRFEQKVDRIIADKFRK